MSAIVGLCSFFALVFLLQLPSPVVTSILGGIPLVEALTDLSTLYAGNNGYLFSNGYAFPTGNDFVIASTIFSAFVGLLASTIYVPLIRLARLYTSALQYQYKGSQYLLKLSVLFPILMWGLLCGPVLGDAKILGFLPFGATRCTPSSPWSIPALRDCASDGITRLSFTFTENGNFILPESTWLNIRLLLLAVISVFTLLAMRILFQVHFDIGRHKQVEVLVTAVTEALSPDPIKKPSNEEMSAEFSVPHLDPPPQLTPESIANVQQACQFEEFHVSLGIGRVALELATIPIILFLLIILSLRYSMPLFFLIPSHLPYITDTISYKIPFFDTQLQPWARILTPTMIQILSLTTLHILVATITITLACLVFYASWMSPYSNIQSKKAVQSESKSNTVSSTTNESKKNN
jgi:Predicted transmembrane protein 161AB